MAKAVLLHREDSQYDDVPGERYQFPPKNYLKVLQAAVGDWVLYANPKKAQGDYGYKAVAFISSIKPDQSSDEGRYVAQIQPGSFVEFAEVVPMVDSFGHYRESQLNLSEGGLNRGLVQRAVRPISEEDFAKIVDLGLPQETDDLPRIDWGTDQSQSPNQDWGLSEPQAVFEPLGSNFSRQIDQILSNRPRRDQNFRRLILKAYGSRCAFTGLSFRNGGGRSEVEAAHIQPVEKGGSDSVRNGLALSGTVHWMFDRGLLGLAPEGKILVSKKVNDRDGIDRLLTGDKQALLPPEPVLRPHPDLLEWHRVNVFER